jgi:hypothetical protein
MGIEEEEEEVADDGVIKAEMNHSGNQGVYLDTLFQGAPFLHFLLVRFSRPFDFALTSNPPQSRRPRRLER